MWAPAAWVMLDCDAAKAGKYSCIAALQASFDGSAVVLRGTMNAVTATLARISRVIDCTSLNQKQKCQMLARYVVRVFRGKPQDISMNELPCTYWPDVYGRMMDSSFAHPTYVPAHLMWSIYAGIFGKFQLASGNWLRLRFNEIPIVHREPLLGLQLRVPPRVFIPDPAVTDLLISAYLSPQSPVPHDLQATVAEPCTGSGLLGMAAARLGAIHVASSDVDGASVECAQRNITHNRLHEHVSVEQADGCPAPTGEKVLLVNPPWHDRTGGFEFPDHYRRCLMDPGRRLLAQLLREAAARSVTVAYVFLGTRNPFTNQVDEIATPDLFSGWRKARTWRSPHGVHLYRLLHLQSGS